MIALISIPHQTPPHIHWYDTEQAIVDAAEEYAEQHGHEPPICHGFDDPVANAAHELADDWHGKILVLWPSDIDEVRNYTGHQEHRIRAIVDELEAEFAA